MGSELKAIKVDLSSIEKILEEAGLSLTHQEAEQLGVKGVMNRIKEARLIVSAKGS